MKLTLIVGVLSALLWAPAVQAKPVRFAVVAPGPESERTTVAVNRLALGLRDAGADVVYPDVVRVVAGPEGEKALTACALAPGDGCGLPPQLTGVDAVVSVSFAMGAYGAVVSAALATGAPLGPREVSADDFIAFLRALEAEGRKLATTVIESRGSWTTQTIRTFGWRTLTAGVALAAIGGAFGINSALGARNLANRGDGGPRSVIAAMEMRDSSNRDAVIAIGVGAAGLAAAIVGSILLARPGGSPVYAVDVAPGAVVLSLQGTF